MKIQQDSAHDLPRFYNRNILFANTLQPFLHKIQIGSLFVNNDFLASLLSALTPQQPLLPFNQI